LSEFVVITSHNRNGEKKGQATDIICSNDKERYLGNDRPVVYRLGKAGDNSMNEIFFEC